MPGYGLKLGTVFSFIDLGIHLKAIAFVIEPNPQPIPQICEADFGRFRFKAVPGRGERLKVHRLATDCQGSAATAEEMIMDDWKN